MTDGTTTDNAARRRHNKQKRAWWRRNMEQHRDASRRWARKNREKNREVSIAWSREHPERVAAALRRMLDRNPNFYAERYARRKLKAAWLKWTTACAASRARRAEAGW